MRCLDASFCFDFLRADPGAIERARAWEREGGRLAIPAPALAEVLRMAYRRGGVFLTRVRQFVARLDILPLDGDCADEAGRLAGDADRRGAALGTVDLLIAAVVTRNRGILVTRDRDFHRIPGLHLETY